MEQLVARWAHNPKVVGSSPAPATEKPVLAGFFHFWFFQVSPFQILKFLVALTQ